MSGGWDDLEHEADERLEQLEQETPEEWGYFLSLAEGERFRGFYVGETEDTASQYGARPVYLLRDEQGDPCYLPGGRKILDAAMDKAAPAPRDLILIARGKDGPGREGGVSYRFVVKTKPAATQELPAESADTGAQPGELPDAY